MSVGSLAERLQADYQQFLQLSLAEKMLILPTESGEIARMIRQEGCTIEVLLRGEYLAKKSSRVEEELELEVQRQYEAQKELEESQKSQSQNESELKKERQEKQ